MTTVETVADAYVPGGTLRLERQQLEAPAIGEKRLETVSAECRFPGELGQVEDVSFLPDFPRQYRENGGVTLEIPGTIQLLSTDGKGKLQASTSRWEGKLNYPLGEDTSLTARPLMPLTPQSISGGYREELPLQLTALGGRGIPMVTELEKLPEQQDPSQRPSLILRRAGEEGLWELAKKTGSTVAAIRSANKLSEEPKPGQLLLIPVC